MGIIFEGKPIKGAPSGGLAMVYPTICFSPYDEQMYGHRHGFFNGKMSIIQVFLLQIILAFVMTKFVYYCLRPLLRSKPVCYILGGIILGPSVLGRSKRYTDIVFPENEMLIFNTMVKIGITYYTFITAVKMDAAMSLKTSKTTWIMSTFCFFSRFIINRYFGEMLIANISGTVPCVVSDELSLTYFIVIAEAMKEHDLLTSELGQLAMSTAMLIEMTCWVPLVTRAVIFQLSCIDAIRVVLILVALALFGVYILRPMIIRIIEITPEGDLVNENYIYAMLLAALIMAMITDLLCGSLFPGVLILGLIIPDGPPLGAAIVEKAELMVMEFFMPFFYVMVGYHTDVSSIFHMDGFFPLMFLVGITHLSTFIGTMVGSIFCEIKLCNAALLGMVLNFKGVLDYETYGKCSVRKVQDNGVYTALILSSLFKTIIYNIVLDIWYKPKERLLNLAPEAQRFRTLQLASHIKELRVLACVHSQDNVRGIITILEASNPSEASPIFAYVIHAIELVGRAAPLLAQYNKKMQRIQSNSTYHIMRAFVNYSRNSRGPVSIRPFTMIAPYRTMHNIICNHARDKHIPLIIVPFQANQEGYSMESSQIRDFNIQLQLNASCTIGLFVDKGLNQRNLEQFSCNIAVIFLGGADDREALSLASRMSRNPDVSITLLRIPVRRIERSVNDFIENRLDELLVEEFMERNSDNACVVSREVVAENSFQLLALIRSLENDYDLVMVGKMPVKAQFVEEMRGWVEHQELGLIGDVLVSTDICKGKLSVLVFQHYVEGGESTPYQTSASESLSIEA
ncbi:cation/H(+) antiporter 15-like [Mercurialis annua]|uniref:cation/H(+) antiporter 15-like n=1 Tax=Mercurialis annua TaxID=3986 RepID=UPI00215E6EEC|nr:cation/H(+) antiporter 15-like [Mercurialis annua]